MKKFIFSIASIAIISSQSMSQNCLPEGKIFTMQSQIDSFQFNYPGCTQIEGDVIISCYGDNITNLTGLNVLTSIGGSLSVSNNYALQNLSGLDNVMSIGGSLIIHDNFSLTSLTGLDNINPNSIIDLVIHNNGNLSTCDVQSICNYLASPNGIVDIFYNAEGCNCPPEIADACGIALSCLPHGNYYFVTQDQVDSFKTDYPGCTVLAGDVLIQGNIVNLNGLDEITSIGGGITFSHTGLINMNGLEAITSIGGDFRIFWNPDLYDLAGLNNLVSIGGELRIETGCYEINSLSGLDNLTNLGGNLHIEDSYSLSTLEALSDLTSIGGYVKISGIHGLTSLAGLENINPASVTHLIITGNSQLSNCNVQSICDYLASPNGIVEIYWNDEGCATPPEIANNCGISLPCLPYGNYYFFSQVQIDSFHTDYTDCVQIEGNVQIGGNSSDISNLFGLGGVASISGELIIDNSSLTDLTGLDDLVWIGGNLEIDLNSITSLAGLQVLTSIGGNLIISDNSALLSLTGLEGLTSIGGDLKIGYIGSFGILHGNPNLLNLTGLSNLTSINGSLCIVNNDSLYSLAGLDQIMAGSISDLEIAHNNVLTNCGIQSICDYLASPSGTISISDNAAACNTEEEVEEACELQGVESHSSLQFAVVCYPNPTSGIFDFRFSIFDFRSVKIEIFDVHGREVANVLDEKLPAGEHTVRWNAENLQSGIYLLRLSAGEEAATGKVVVRR